VRVLQAFLSQRNEETEAPHIRRETHRRQLREFHQTL
jgi:hypothetical protein